MTQTATFPDLESLPTVSNQAILYFSSTMGTLTEVDVVTSGSFSSEFSAENLGPSSSTIAGTTGGNLAINVPTGAIPVTIPAVTRTFVASAFDGTLDYGGTSGQDLTLVANSSTPQTTVLTSPTDLAAFTGHFRIPISVSGHATGNANSDNGDLSAGFKTHTSATITVIYHFIPNLPSLDPPPGSPPTSNSSGTTADSGTTTLPTEPASADAGVSSFVQAPPTPSQASSTRVKKNRPLKTGTPFHQVGHHSSGGHLRQGSGGPLGMVKTHPTNR